MRYSKLNICIITFFSIVVLTIIGPFRSPSLAYAAHPNLLSCGSPIRIMPLGDSITMGYSSGVDEEEKMVSYRRDLWRSLVAAGYSVQFVGSFDDGSFYAPEGFDPNHEGHSGETPKYVGDNVYDFLTAHPADVVLLHIGTNGLGTTNGSVAQVENILESIAQYEIDKSTEVTVLVARIINRTTPSSATTTFNNDVAAMVQARQTAGDKVSMVDMETGAGLVYSIQPSGDMWDNLHPYATGYTKMAAVWYNALQGILPQCQTLPKIISTPSTDATVLTPYSYDVNAMGSPTLTYALAAPIPTGMTINTTTGVISWTPTAAGPVNVTVTATNSQGTATQPFVINVASQTLPEFTSTPVTQAFVGQVYGYDANANGVPEPTYSLAAPIPSGMSINPTTGVISWTPNATGSVNVTVTATNSQGSVNQSFTITVTASVCPADMSGHWKLDEVGSPTNFIDSYGGNNGTCTPGSCPSPGAGIVNGGMAFNGNHMINVPNSASLNWANSDSFSLEAWIKPAQACTGTEVVLGKYASSGATWWLGCVDGTNAAALFLRDSTTSNTLTLEGTKDLNDGKWHHLVATRNAATNEHQLYVDGVSEASASHSFTGTFTNNNPLNLGYYLTNSPSFPFIGTLDEVAIYKRALSSAEITGHYNAGSGQAYCGQQAPIIISTPVTTATINQPYSYDVNAIGNPTPTYALSAPIPTGMTINPTTGVISWTPTAAGPVNVTVTATNSHDTATQSFVINVADLSAPVFTSTPVTQASVGEPYSYDVNAIGIPTPTYGLAAPIPSGMTINPTTGVISWTPTASGPVNVTVTATNSQDTATQAFVINVAVSVCPADITSYWKLNEVGSPTSFADSRGTNTATCTAGSCPTPSAGIVGGGMSFSGDMINVPNSASLNWANGDSFTLEAWIKTTQACSGNEVVLGKYASNGATWWLGCEDGTNTAAFVLRDSTSTEIYMGDTKALNDGKWHHLVASRNATTNEHQLYVDGALKSTVTQAFTGNFTNSNPLTMGYFLTGSPGFFFNGTLDEVAIYKRALSLAEITEHYNAGSGRAYCGERPPTITSTPVTVALKGDVYTYDVNATGNPTPTYRLVAPVPTGMTIVATTGVISWTPGTVGTFNVTVAADNSEGTATQTFAIVVTDKKSAPQIISTAITEAAKGEVYSYDVEATGLPTPTYELPIHPTGMTIDPTTGVISWTPNSLGTFNVKVTATNTEGTDPQTFAIVVTNQKSIPKFISTAVTKATVGETYTYDVNATGLPTPTYELPIHPTGMTINPTTGVISWTPSTVGTFNVKVNAINSQGTVSQSFSISVAKAGSPANKEIFLPFILK